MAPQAAWAPTYLHQSLSPSKPHGSDVRHPSGCCPQWVCTTAGRTLSSGTQMSEWITSQPCLPSALKGDIVCHLTVSALALCFRRRHYFAKLLAIQTFLKRWSRAKFVPLLARCAEKQETHEELFPCETFIRYLWEVIKPFQVLDFTLTEMRNHSSDTRWHVLQRLPWLSCWE